MHASSDLWLFFAMVFGVIALPGMDMAFVASNALTQGLRGGLTAVAGIVVAGMLHVIVGATGVAALLLWWPAAYDALLVAGAVYMVWVGASILRSADAGPAASGATSSSRPTPQGAIFRRAALTCLLNPKAYAFMLAVFPAFIRSNEYALPVQALRLGTVIAITQCLVYGAVAVFVAQARRWTGASAQGQRWAARAVGVALIAGAVLTLVFAWQPVPGFAQASAEPRPSGRSTHLAGGGGAPPPGASFTPEAACRSPASRPTGSSCRSAVPARRLG
jgi:threonine/homoserine/homoserine lactone efflux protein